MYHPRPSKAYYSHSLDLFLHDIVLNSPVTGLYVYSIVCEKERSRNLYARPHSSRLRPLRTIFKNVLRCPSTIFPSESKFNDALLSSCPQPNVSRFPELVSRPIGGSTYRFIVLSADTTDAGAIDRHRFVLSSINNKQIIETKCGAGCFTQPHVRVRSCCLCCLKVLFS